MANIPFHRARMRLVDRKQRSFERRLASFRRGMIATIIVELLADIEIENNRISGSLANIQSINKIDRIIESYVAGSTGLNFIRSIVSDINEVAELNKKYYAANLGRKDIDQTWSVAQGYLNAYFGVDDRGRVQEGSILMDAVTSKQWVRRLKASVIHGVENNLTVNQMKEEIERAGVRFDRQVMDTIPNVYDKAENVIGNQVSKEEEMHFAYYQGGIMDKTRPFCEERNNKVFHVSEIAKFGTPDDEYGGYTNKSQGEFQGKTDPYDPFIDVGGYNCRHRYFYVSNELGFRLRPDLDPDSVEVPDNWVMT